MATNDYNGRRGNWNSSGHTGNAGGGAPTGSANGVYHPTLHRPATAPTPGVSFTFQRVAKTQCESNEVYRMELDSTEGEYFYPLIIDALQQAKELQKDSDAPQHPVIAAFADRADASVMEVDSVKYNQLRFLLHPELTGLAFPFCDLTYAPGIYECYTFEHEPEKVLCVNPGGYRYEVKRSNSWVFSFTLVVKVDLGEFRFNSHGELSTIPMVYAARFTCKSLPANCGRERTYLHHTKPKSQVVCIEYGEIVASMFVAWGVLANEPAMVYVADKTLVDGMFKYTSWPLVSRNHNGNHHDSEDEDEVPRVSAAFQTSAKYLVENQDHQLSMWVKKGKEEGCWTRLCNFAIDTILNIYEFDDRDKGRPVFRLKIHRVLHEDNDECIYLSPEVGMRLNAHITAGRLEGEVLVPICDLKDQNALHTCFQSVSSYFMCEDLTLIHLKIHLNNMLPWPHITRVLTYFGKQKREDVFVLGNACFNSEGRVFPLDTSGVGILPFAFTTGKNALCAWPQEDFPRMRIIQQPWVRYAFFVQFYSGILPDYFLNNTMAMKASFALNVMHSHCDRFWAGDAIGKSVGAPPQ